MASFVLASAGMKNTALIAITAFVLACAGYSSAGGRIEAAAGEELTLAAGQTATIDGGALSVRFVGVPHDSRCPIDVECITAGNAVVRLRLANGEGPKEVELNTTVGPKEATHAGYTVHLEALRPGNTSGTRIRQGIYRAVLRVTKA